MQNRKKKITFFIGLALVNAVLVYLVLEAGCSCLQGLRHEISVIRLYEGQRYVAHADVDGDGSDDMLLHGLPVGADDRPSLKCVSPFMQPGDRRFSFFFDKLTERGQAASTPVDIDGDRLLEIPLLARDTNTAQLTFWNIFGEGKGDITQFILPWTLVRESDINQYQIADLDGDGSLELVMLVKTYWSGSPRGVVVYSLKSGKRREFALGTQPDFMRILDINGDGKSEIILSTIAPNNGAKANGYDDDKSYLMIFNSRCERPQSQIIGGPYSTPYFDCADIDSDGNLEIIVSKTCHSEESSEPGDINILDGRLLKAKHSLPGPRQGYSAIHCCRVNGKSFAAVGDATGQIQLLDDQLHSVRATAVEAPAMVMGAATLGQPGRQALYLAVYSGYSFIHLLDDRLNVVHTAPTKGWFDFNLVHFKFVAIRHKNETAGLLVLPAEGFLARHQAPSFGKLASLAMQTRLFIFLPLLLGVNLLVALAMRLRPVFANFSGATRSEWNEIAQAIAHRMKNPLFTIQLENEKLQSLAVADGGLAAGTLRQSTSSILEDVGKLKEMTRSLMKVLSTKNPDLRQVEINSVVKRMVERYQGAVEGGIKFSFEPDSETVQAHIDPNQIEEALAIIIENAMDSMPQGGTVRVSTLKKTSPLGKVNDEAIIEVEDNGCGIPEDQKARIFEPYFSTKSDGSGLGLTVARRIVESHGGWIEFESRAGLGSRFALHLPAWKR
jgi:signal transduction histidine kinase